MKYVNKCILIFLLLLSFQTFSQKGTDKLKKEQERLEKNISNTKNLLEKTKSSAEATLNELKLIDNQVKFREQLLLNFDNQIKSTELKIEQKTLQIEQLENKLISLKEQYKQLTIYAYKKRSKSGKLMFIFSSKSYYEALKRKKYLDKVAEIQKKQKLIILQHKKLILEQKTALIQDKNYKEKVAEEKRKEKQEILKDKDKQIITLTKLKSEEEKLLAKLQIDEAQRLSIKKQIDAAIEKELATKKKANTKSNTKTTNTEKNAENVTFIEPKELELNNSFESNKGRLPWPVSSGSITEGYGKNPHPTIPNVYTNNNGIDISAAKGAQVRAVFEGEVTSVFSIPGAGKVIIIKHGNYRTVYSNLQESYVTVGTKVNTKQAIGSLLVSESESVSVSHFEIHQVVGSNVNRMNPSLWISR
jgi:murein hydrolase activator